MKYVFKIPAASEYDLTGMENWLEEMAQKGLYLKWYRSFICCFVRGEPKKARVRLEPNPRHMLEIELTEDKEAFYRDLGWHFACEISQSALVFYADSPDVPELHTDPTLLVEQMRALIRRVNRQSWALGVVLALGSAFLFRQTWRYGISTPEDLYKTAYLGGMLLFGLFTLLLDRKALRRLREMEGDMEEGVTPERLPTSPQWRRQQLLRGVSALIFYAVVFFSPFAILLIRRFFGNP